MKAATVNIAIDGFRQCFREVIGSEVEKKGMALQEKLLLKKEWGIVFPFSGDANGMMVVSFEEGVAVDLAGKMTGGMGDAKSFDEMNQSALEELGGMIKGKMIQAFSEEDMAVEVAKASLQPKGEISFDGPILYFSATSPVGEIDVFISLT